MSNIKVRCVSSNELPATWESVDIATFQGEHIDWYRAGVIADQGRWIEGDFVTNRWTCVIFDLPKSKGSSASFRLLAEARRFAKNFVRQQRKSGDGK